jgi:hypothetical protein
MSRSHSIIGSGYPKHTCIYRDCPIHAHSRRIRNRRKERKNKHKYAKRDCEAIHDEPESASKIERRWQERQLPHATPRHASYRDHVGCGRRDGTYGYDDIPSYCRADVDAVKNAGNQCGNEEGIDGDAEPRRDSRHPARTGGAAVPSEGKELARCACHTAEIAGQAEDDEDRGKSGSARSRAGGQVVNLDDWVSGRC